MEINIGFAFANSSFGLNDATVNIYSNDVDASIYSFKVVSDHVVANEKLDIKLFDFYPNPANDQVNITLSSNVASNYNINIMDLSGKTVRSTLLLQGEMTSSIYLDGIAKGIYLFSITDESDRVLQTEKLITQ